jgi:hypothetical protein
MILNLMRLLFCLIAATAFTANSAFAAEVDERDVLRRIAPPATMTPDLKAAVDDLASSLRQITRPDFRINAGDAAAGIIICRSNAADVPADAAAAVPTSGTEGFVIWPDGPRLWIIAKSDAGLCHGIYTYLETLGCRWYFPSDRWTIVPKRDSIAIAKPIVSAPAFAMRQFFGTGGFGGKLQLDPQMSIQSRWETWKRRNRFGGEIALAGHSGEAFNLTYRKTLEAHPEYRAMNDGKRVDWSLTAKFCSSNPEVVALYVKDRVETYRRARKANPDSPRSWAVSVEPADGGGHCTCPDCLKLGSASDRVFHVANEVARAIRAEFPDGRVSLFAYNEHAAPPRDALEPNVYVAVIPYAFQRTDMSPDKLLDAWAAKVPRMSVYDYWSIPDWALDLPSFDALEFGSQRLRGWNSRHVDGFLCESTFSSGAMGPAWYIGSRLSWDPAADPEILFDDFVKGSFGPAQEPMRRMLKRWSLGFTLTSHELALSFRDIAAARQLAAKDSAIQGRIADYARYVEYLRRRFDYQQSKPGTDARKQSAHRLMEWIWGVYDSSMIHAFRLSQLLARDEGKTNPEFAARYNWQDRKAAGWKEIKPVTDEQALDAAHRGVAELQPLGFETRRFTGELTPLAKPSANEGYSPPFLLSSGPTLNVQMSAAQKVTLKISAPQSVRVTVSDAAGNVVLNKSVETKDWTKDVEDVVIPAAKDGLYKVQLWSPKRPLRLSVPMNVAISFDGWSNSQGAPSPRIYFYIPSNVSRLAIHAPYTAAGPPRFFDPEGKDLRSESHDNGTLLLIDVPEGQRGKVWSLDRAKCPTGPLRLLNAPAAFAMSPDALLVPKDALEK